MTELIFLLVLFAIDWPFCVLVLFIAMVLP